MPEIFPSDVLTAIYDARYLNKTLYEGHIIDPDAHSVQNVMEPETNNTGRIGGPAKRYADAHLQQITLGGVTRTTWPAAGSGSQSMDDVYDNGSVVNVDTTDVAYHIGADKKILMTDSDGSTIFFSAHSDGLFGFGNDDPRAIIHVGDRTDNNSVDSQILISRAVDDSVANNGHGFSDSSYITRSGGRAYNSYDARVYFGGDANFDHYAAFQASAVFQGSGTLSDVYDLYSGLTVNSGIVTTFSGVRVVNKVGAGTLVNQYGLYVEELTSGTEKNYGVWLEGNTPAYVGGNVLMGAAAAVALASIGNTSTNGNDSTLDFYGKSGGGVSLNAQWHLTNTAYYDLNVQGKSGALRVDTTNGDITVGTSIYITSNCSALSFTDRTPHFGGDALTEIMRVSGRGGEIDHETLPEFAKVRRIKDNDEGGEEVVERDLGAMISILTVAVQQLNNKLKH